MQPVVSTSPDEMRKRIARCVEEIADVLIYLEPRAREGTCELGVDSHQRARLASAIEGLAQVGSRTAARMDIVHLVSEHLLAVVARHSRDVSATQIGHLRIIDLVHRPEQAPAIVGPEDAAALAAAEIDLTAMDNLGGGKGLFLLRMGPDRKVGVLPALEDVREVPPTLMPMKAPGSSGTSPRPSVDAAKTRSDVQAARAWTSIAVQVLFVVGALVVGYLVARPRRSPVGRSPGKGHERA